MYEQNNQPEYMNDEWADLLPTAVGVISSTYTDGDLQDRTGLKVRLHFTLRWFDSNWAHLQIEAL